MSGSAATRVHAGARHGAFETVALDDGMVRLECVPAFGAKIVSLVDVRTGREWLTRGEPPPGGDADDAVFGGDAAYGWDECLPSVAPADDPVRIGRRLRDHGDAWGRPVAVTVADGAIETTAEGRGWPYRLHRRLRLEGASVAAEYALEHTAPSAAPAHRPLPFLWSMHPLLALEPGSRIELPAGVREVTVSHGAGTSLPVGGRVPWPRTSGESRHGGLEGLRLDEVRPIQAGEALKLYAGPLANPWARAVTPSGASLTVRWDAAIAPFLGLWLDYGGWPSADPRERLHQVALEPTTAPADDLASAIAAGRIVELAPGGRVSWWVRFDLAPDVR